MHEHYSMYIVYIGIMAYPALVGDLIAVGRDVACAGLVCVHSGTADRFHHVELLPKKYVRSLSSCPYGH